LASARGYLDRLVDGVATRPGRAARSPRQIAWGPTRPATPLADDEVGDLRRAAPPVPAAPRVPRRTTELPPPPAPSATVPPPAHEPGLRVVTAPLVANPVVSKPDSPVRAESRPAAPANRPGRVPAVPARPASAVPANPPRPDRTGGQHPVAAPPRPTTPATLPAPVTEALARLSALSGRLDRQAQPAAARLPEPSAAPEPTRAAGPRADTVHPAPAAVPVPRPAREQPVRTPQVHIGTIEVTIAAAAPPPPAPAPVAAPQQPAPVAAAPAARLSRPATAFGLGQG